jgi:molybdenum cofactor cytidylyltransferase
MRMMELSLQGFGCSQVLALPADRGRGIREGARDPAESIVMKNGKARPRRLPAPVPAENRDQELGDGFAAVVLAGGHSSRMRRFKPLLPFGESTVIEHAVGAFLGAGVREVVVVVGHRGERLRPLLERLPVRCVTNQDFDRGMYSSLVVGMQALRPQVEACFVLPADMPAVRSHTVALLARTYRRTGADVLYPVFCEQRGHPPLVSSRLFGAIVEGDGTGGLRSLLARFENRARGVQVLDEGVVLDLDTPDDYSRICEDCGDRSVPTLSECQALLAEMQVPESVVRHGKVVASVAQRLAERLVRRGLRIDVALVRAAGLLHDLAKGSPDHAAAGARSLRRLGFPRVAAVVAEHTDIFLNERSPLNESSLVFLADKLVQGDRIVPLQSRFQAALQRHGGAADARQAIDRRWRNAEAIAAVVEKVLQAELLNAVEE